MKARRRSSVGPRCTSRTPRVTRKAAPSNEISPIVIWQAGTSRAARVSPGRRSERRGREADMAPPENPAAALAKPAGDVVLGALVGRVGEKLFGGTELD